MMLSPIVQVEGEHTNDKNWPRMSLDSNRLTARIQPTLAPANLSLPQRLLRHQSLPRRPQLGSLVANRNLGQLTEIVTGSGGIPGRVRRPGRAVQGVEAVGRD